MSPSNSVPPALEDRLGELKHVRDGMREQEKAMENQVERIMKLLSLEEGTGRAGKTGVSA